MMSSDQFEIEDLIPQRSPFMMVDKIISCDEVSTTTSFYITENNLFCENGIFREPGMIENIAQTVAAGRGFLGRKDHKAPSVGYIGSVKFLKVYFLPKANSTLTTTIKITSQVLNFTSVAGQIISEDKIAAECELVIAVNH
jgi:3-hydroxymyristoyl/3-hydroxydecanoyl-(acyl carrier protein) dehydratase